MNIIGLRKRFYVVSLILLVIAVGSLLVRGLNLGIDFTSGTVLEIDFKEAYSTDEIREVLATFDLDGARIRTIGDLETIAEIRTPAIDNEELFSALLAGFESRWPDSELVASAQVDPLFSGELVRQALFALIIASIGMIAYISWRFEFKFAISAILALLHDVILLLGFFSLFQIEINGEFVAAVLTIVGYSINDTIVVFDRIRENLGLAKRLSEVERIVNSSIVQTLVRSINTSLTTLLAVGSILFLGGVTLQPLATALFFGVIAGTYSSIFVASSVWVDWKQREQAKRA